MVWGKGRTTLMLLPGYGEQHPLVWMVLKLTSNQGRPRNMMAVMVVVGGSQKTGVGSDDRGTLMAVVVAMESRSMVGGVP